MIQWNIFHIACMVLLFLIAVLSGWRQQDSSLLFFGMLWGVTSAGFFIGKVASIIVTFVMVFFGKG